MVYLLQVTLCWAVFYLLYALWLSRETFFRVNRWYLLGTLVLGMVIPLVEWQQFFITENHPIVVPLDNFYYNVQAIEYQIQRQPETTWLDVVWLIYQVGLLLFTLRFAHGLWKLYQLYQCSTYEQQGNIRIVYTDTEHLPFSFFNLLFWSKAFQAKYDEQQQILRHEEAHISGWHTVDVLFMEILGILFWCSPMIYLYRASMRNVHEYLADAWVLQTTTRKTYGRLLLQQSISGFQIALANNFMNSQLKKRIIMMTRNHSPKQAIMKYLFLLPIIVLAVLVFSKREHLPSLNAAYAAVDSKFEQSLIPPNDSIYKVVIEMPRFAGCEDLPLAERGECAKKKMLEFIYTNIKYPEAAKDAGQEGTTVVKFVVEKDGSVSGANMVRSPGEGVFDTEVLRVTNMMPNFIPGKNRAGEAVRVYYHLPVKFKLADDTATETREEEEPKIVEGATGIFDQEWGKDMEGYKFVLNINAPNNSLPPMDFDSAEEARKVVLLFGEKMKSVCINRNLEAKVATIDLGLKEDIEFDSINSKEEGNMPDIVGSNAPIMLGNALNERLKIEDLVIAPNPSNGVFEVSFAAPAQPTEVQILTATGRKIFTWDVSDFNGETKGTINLERTGYPSGTYYMRIMQGDKVHIEPIVIQK